MKGDYWQPGLMRSRCLEQTDLVGLPCPHRDQAQRDPIKQANRAKEKANDIVMRMLVAVNPLYPFSCCVKAT